MLSRDSVKSRIESPQGISFCEFSYQSLQGYDFLHLLKNYNCSVQIGGSDQWGNIVAGIDLISRHAPDRPAFGLTIPLLTSALGEKFGKSAGNALWLDPDRTSPFIIYQYFLRCPDLDVVRLLKILTFLPQEEIEQLEAEHARDPGKRVAHQALADAVIAYLYGQECVTKARKCTEALFGGSLQGLSCQELEAVFEGLPRIQGDINNSQRLSVLEALVKCGACTSKGEFVQTQTQRGTGHTLEDSSRDFLGEAKRLIAGGGVYVNNQRVESAAKQICPEDLIDERLCLLGVGKSSRFLVVNGTETPKINQ